MSIDTMESRNPGFLAQLKGTLTKICYKFTTVFKDHYSDLICAHIHQYSHDESSLEAKKALEAHARKNGIGIKHYYTENGRFADMTFIAHAESRNQTISCCASNAHHQMEELIRLQGIFLKGPKCNCYTQYRHLQQLRQFTYGRMH